VIQTGNATIAALDSDLKTANTQIEDADAVSERKQQQAKAELDKQVYNATAEYNAAVQKAKDECFENRMEPIDVRQKLVARIMVSHPNARPAVLRHRFIHGGCWGCT